MRIALAQINSHLGAYQNNANKILEYIGRAKERGAEIVLFPEASLFGYHPVDLLERPSQVKSQLKALQSVHKKMPPDILAIVGGISMSPLKSGKLYNNSAWALEKNKKIKTFAKQLLPTYDVFDEGRHIEPGDVTKNILSFKGRKILVTICEDIWAWPNNHHGSRSPYVTNPLKKIPKSKVDLVLNLSASPFTHDKFKSRLKVCQQTARHFKSQMVYVNMVGGQDEIVFDGASFVLNKKGELIAQATRFEEDILVYDSENLEGHVKKLENNKIENVRSALVLGIRDFVRKTNFKKVHLGLSGGIDSAVVACLAADALGPHNVHCIALPGPFSSKESYDLAKGLADNLAIEWEELNITEVYKSLSSLLAKGFGEFEFGLVNENIQARLRGLSLMAYSNLKSSLLLNTSNKSELATGYSTLYGDLVGGLCPIGDLVKTQVFELAEHYNVQHELIPRGIIDRPPSAELSPDQKDSDTLPEYHELDKVVQKLVEKFSAPKTELEHRVLNMMMTSEFKRWQAPPILKVSNHSFGRGRRLPIAHASRV